MCTLLVFAAASNTHADSTKDQRGCWKRGMIVEIYEDGRCTEAPSSNSKMVFVHIPGVSKAQAEKYLEQTETRRRTFILDWSTLPTVAKNTLQNTRELTVTLTQVKKYIRSLITNQLEG